jgi:hypothetical protein
MKHGPIALIADRLPVIALVPRDSSYERMLGNMEEVRARDGMLIAIAHPNDRAVAAKAEHAIEIPPVVELLAPLATVVPLQLLAHHVAPRRAKAYSCWITRRGCTLAWTTTQASPVGAGGKRRHPRGDENTGLGANKPEAQ